MGNNTTTNQTQGSQPQDPTPELNSSQPDNDAIVKHQRLFKQGIKWLGTGVLLMGLSFALNFILFHSDHSIRIPMYCLTTLGTLCIVKGLADVLGF